MPSEQLTFESISGVTDKKTSNDLFNRLYQAACILHGYVEKASLELILFRCFSLREYPMYMMKKQPKL
jgi:hypothetical protein